MDELTTSALLESLASLIAEQRAGTLGAGGIGIALACLYLAFRVAYVRGVNTISAQMLEDVADLTIGHEDAQRVAEVVAEPSGMRRVV